MKRLFKCFSIFLLSLSSLFIPTSNDNQPTLSNAETNNVSLRANNYNAKEDKEPDFYLHRNEDCPVHEGEFLLLYLHSRNVVLSSLQLEIRYDKNYFTIENAEHYFPCNTSRGDILDINYAHQGVVSLSFASLYNVTLENDILYLPFFAKNDIASDVSTYINVIIKKAINMDDANVNIVSKGFYADIFKSNFEETDKLYAHNTYYLRGNEFKNKEQFECVIYYSMGNSFSSFDIDVDYDRDNLKFISYEFPYIPNFLGDVNSSTPGILRIKGSSTKNLSQGTKLIRIRFEAINTSKVKTSIRVIYNSLINSDYQKVESDTNNINIDLDYMKGEVARLYGEVLQSDHVIGLSIAVCIEIDQPLGAIDIFMQHDWLFNTFQFKECIANDIPNATIGVNINDVSNNKIKISLLSSSGVMGKMHVATINFKPLYQSAFNASTVLSFSYHDAVSPELQNLHFTCEELNISVRHYHKFEWTITKEPTCQNEGEKHGVCFCGIEVDESIPMLPHTVESWTTIAEPHYFLTGTKEGYCTSCQQTVFDSIPYLLEDKDFYECQDFAFSFLNANICGTDDNTPASSELFLNQAKLFEKLSDNSKFAFKNEDLTNCYVYPFTEMLGRYERIISLHGADSKRFPNFMGRNVDIIKDNSNSLIDNWSTPETLTNVVIVFICLVPILSIPALILLVDKKRKNIHR